MRKETLEIGFYGILTDPVVGYERLAEVMVEQGIKVIQLRMKNTSEAEVEGMACELRVLGTSATTGDGIARLRRAVLRHCGYE